MSDYNTELFRWLSGGHSPYHTVAAAAEYLNANGFSALELSEPFAIERGGRYFVRNVTCLTAFTVGQ